jgi:hypothetical protein
MDGLSWQMTNAHLQGCKQICAQAFCAYGKCLGSFISAHETWDQHFTLRFIFLFSIVNPQY